MFKKIKIEDALELENSIILDTRTPNEYELDHLPNAINVPIFTNKQREIIGTIYKQISKPQAMDRGLFFYTQNLPNILKKVEGLKNKNIIVHCWRGGMRSKAISFMLSIIGYKVYQLIGGYKEYRNYVRTQLETFEIKPRMVVFYGKTGTGKTLLIKHFENMIDLEEMAGHRGSLYGGIGIIQSSQKKFENLLWQKLNELKNEKYIFIEGESKRIGNCIMPPFLWKAMQKGIKFHIAGSVKNRAQIIVDEYFQTKENIEKIKEITKILQKNISNKRKQEVIDLIDNKQYVESVSILLTDYYDPLYTHTLSSITFDYEVNSDLIETAVESIKKTINSL